jgi:hypothetical protein
MGERLEIVRREAEQRFEEIRRATRSELGVATPKKRGPWLLALGVAVGVALAARRVAARRRA